MSELGYIIIFTLIGSIGSLIGGMLLLLRKNSATKIAHYLSAFAAGTLLAGAFFDLLPESFEHHTEHGGDAHELFIWVLGGILIFFLLERFIHWFHHSHTQDYSDSNAKPTVPLVIAGDTMHNFIDGIVIGATFMVSIPLGIITTIAVAAHEIPQEIGDFGILLKNGMSRIKIVFFNLLSASVSLIGALIAYKVGDSIEGILPMFIAVTAGFFIYIALADLIPEIHKGDNKRRAFIESLMVLLGILLVYLLTSNMGHSH
jgi:zinc and cadmium transporter